jgi:hypothetical protein
LIPQTSVWGGSRIRAIIGLWGTDCGQVVIPNIDYFFT